MNRISYPVWFFLIGISIFLFFPEIFFLQKGFLSGDHRLQHFPWFVLYANGLKNGALPWWTSFNQCGFPLLAEGQIGAFYPLNFIFAFFLPLRWAYNYEILFHFWLGGIFFFLYARTIGSKPIAAFFATLIFLFGSCQGGFFYNVTSQRVLVWYPPALILIHRLIDRQSCSRALGLGGVFALASVTGYQQYAVYLIGFSTLYFLLLWLVKRGNVKSIFLFGLSLCFSFLVALPQWVPFLELAQFSSRLNVSESFAYQGSLNPLGPLTLFFPNWQGFLNCELYIGILGIFFAIYALTGKRDQETRLHLGLVLLALTLAWGKYSPLYLAFVKLTKFYGFRIPVKFLFFAGFSLAVLAGKGMEKMLAASSQKAFLKFQKDTRIFAWALAVLTTGAFIAAFVLKFWKRAWLQLLENWIQSSVVGQPDRPHHAEVYLNKLHSFYENVLWNVNLLNPWFQLVLLFFVLSCAALFFLAKQKSTSPRNFLIALVFLVLYLDLYRYGYRNIRGDYEKYSFVYRDSEVIDYLKREEKGFRYYLYDPKTEREETILVSNSNIVDGLESIGIYSPFAFQEYKKLLGSLGSVDDSISNPLPNESVVSEGLPLLRFLNVKYIVATQPLDHSELDEVLRGNQFILYRIRKQAARFWYVSEEDWAPNRLEPTLEKAKSVSVDGLIYDQGAFNLRVRVPQKGYLVASEVNYPGWQAWVNGKDVPWVNFLGLFKALPLGPGEHQIAAKFKPRYAGLTQGIALLSLMAYFVSFILKKPAMPAK